MLNISKFNKLTRSFAKKKFSITCQKQIIKQIFDYKKNNSMDKKSLISSLNDKIKSGLKNNYQVNDLEENWISVLEASRITGLTRPMLYNLIAEDWFETKTIIKGQNREVIMLFKPHVLTYSTQNEIIEELIKSGYIKEEIDKVTGKRRYLEFQTSASKIGELEVAVKWQSVYKTFLKLQELFQKIEFSVIDES